MMKRDRNPEHDAERACPVDLGRVVDLLVDGGHAGQENDQVRPEHRPDEGDHHRDECGTLVREHVWVNETKSDVVQ
jgi:hypothetical protein